MCNRLQGILSRRSANKREMGEKVSRAYPKVLKNGLFLNIGKAIMKRHDK
jgi:hypothetical protein